MDTVNPIGDTVNPIGDIVAADGNPLTVPVVADGNPLTVPVVADGNPLTVPVVADGTPAEVAASAAVGKTCVEPINAPPTADGKYVMFDGVNYKVFTMPADEAMLTNPAVGAKFFKVLTDGTEGGRRKKQRKSAKKQRKSAKKQHKSAKKQHKSSKKQRKSRGSRRSKK